MLNKIKEFISQRSTEIKAPDPVAIIENNEQKTINKFQKFLEEISLNENYPKRAIDPLKSILTTLNEIDSQTIGLQDQALIRKIVDKEIPQIIDLYLSLPKAHAVSYILENGKTSKDTLIIKLVSLAKQISTIWDIAIREKTNLLMKKQKNTNNTTLIKKDFFDM